MSEPVWDDAKHRRNLARRGLGFDEAASALDDPHGVTWADVGHSLLEERYITVGLAVLGGLVVVVTSTDEYGTTRIISARRATKRERHAYETGEPPD